MRNLLLLLPVVVALIPPLYNHAEPSLGGFPFFFWSLLALIPVTALCIYLAYKMGAR